MRSFLIAFTLMLVATALAMSPAGAAKYKWVDDEGATHYSDTPPPGHAPEDVELKDAELPEITPAAPYLPAVKLSPAGTSNSKKSALKYSVQILSPENDAALRNNAGTVSVSVRVDPPIEDKGVVVLMMDGKPVGKNSTGSFTLQNVDRGTHTLSARLESNRGAVLAESSSISFTLKRHSSLF